MGRISRQRIVVEGLVQGVGFRPFVYREATARGLLGWVRNEAAGVVIDVEGDDEVLGDFTLKIRDHAPALAAITAFRSECAPTCNFTKFRIEASPVDHHPALVSADLATCDACVEELLDPSDRRYRYPFLSCSSCGPRFTIQRALPYDRQRTTMAGFTMCSACRTEYEDPADRRFHAQPIACAECGPRLRAGTAAGAELDLGESALSVAARAILAGQIVALKGLGGYHLACDATSSTAVRRLRVRKAREAKPFAVMAADPRAAAALCQIDNAEAKLLASSARPIVLLRKRAGCGLSDEVAPNTSWLGLMLPYTPLHHLLVRQVGRAIVLTSGNRSDEPIVVDDVEALAALGEIADLFLSHDRAITSRCDDSVVRVQLGGAAAVRRSRGYAPLPVTLPRPATRPVLAVGGQLKNTFCLVRGRQAFLSHHVGDVEQPESYRALRDGLAHYSRLLGIAPEVVAHDLHPDYQSTRIALELSGVERVGVQHHHAHVAACMADNGATGPVLGVVFDGSGYGTDGAVWGGEFLLVDDDRCQRIGQLGYVPLPGGDAAVRQPVRMAAAHLISAYGPALDHLPIAFAERFAPAEWKLLQAMIERGLHRPPTSSAGRLFDAVSALLGLCSRARYEGEAAIALEQVCNPAVEDAYGFDLRESTDLCIAECASVVRAVVQDLARGQSRSDIAARFHNSLRDLVVTMALHVRQSTGVARVALTGGVFQNLFLLERTVTALQARNFEVLLHRQVPCNDGGLSLGQAVVAAHAMEA